MGGSVNDILSSETMEREYEGAIGVDELRILASSSHESGKLATAFVAGPGESSVVAMTVRI